MTVEISQNHFIYFSIAVWIFVGILHHIKCLSRIEKFNNILPRLDTTELVRKYIFTNKYVNCYDGISFDNFMEYHGYYYRKRFNEIIKDNDVAIKESTKIGIFALNVLFALPCFILLYLLKAMSIVLYPFLVVMSKIVFGKFVTRYPIKISPGIFTNFASYTWHQNLDSRNAIIIAKAAIEQAEKK